MRLSRVADENQYDIWLLTFPPLCRDHGRSEEHLVPRSRRDGQHGSWRSALVDEICRQSSRHPLCCRSVVTIISSCLVVTGWMLINVPPSRDVLRSPGSHQRVPHVYGGRHLADCSRIHHNCRGGEANQHSFTDRELTSDYITPGSILLYVSRLRGRLRRVGREEAALAEGSTLRCVSLRYNI